MWKVSNKDGRRSSAILIPYSMLIQFQTLSPSFQIMCLCRNSLKSEINLQLFHLFIKLAKAQRFAKHLIEALIPRIGVYDTLPE